QTPLNLLKGALKVEEFMKAYTIKEGSGLIGVPQGTIRQWENDFSEHLVVPRDAQNARYYTEFEIEILNHIKTMRQNNLSKKMIKELLKKKNETGSDNAPSTIEPTVPALKQSEAIETLRNVQSALESFPEIKEALISELRDNIKHEIKNEITTAVRKEIASSLEANSNNASEQFKAFSESLNSMEVNYKNEIERRDKLLMENMRLMKELKEQKKKGFFKRLFDK